ncbi:MAG: rRNA maturation RNase YbeY [Gammaproteobacteria bacterium]|nr:rRNA maturation RNase YbeY [Gammaproteobacteria bacterium]
MSLELDLQVAVESNTDCYPSIPDETAIQSWAEAAQQATNDGVQLSVRIVDEVESAELNETYRHKQGPTNVLSFPFEALAGVDIALLGDLVICAPVVEKEARAQGKTSEAHWAHMVVHGCLHLQGYDHIEQADAEKMEGLEIEVLHGLGYANPY